MMSVALAMAAALVAPDQTPLTFVHGDEQIVTWLDRGSMRRAGDRVRLRVLRIRHPDQAFWVAQEIDCAAGTWALVGTRTVTGTDDAPPTLDGPAPHQRIRRDDHSGRALRSAGCDGVFLQAAVQPVRGAATAIARLTQTKTAAIRARPLELIVVRAGRAPVFLDRATLEGGGPQWEVRSLRMTGARGLWSGWEIDCERADLAVKQRWTAPLVDGAYGAVTDHRVYSGSPVADADQAAIVATTCAADVWDRPVQTSIEAAMRAAGANPR